MEQEMTGKFENKIQNGIAQVPIAREETTRLSALFAAVQYPLDGGSELELVRNLIGRMNDQRASAKRVGAS
jgi:hypothetical protein